MVFFTISGHLLEKLLLKLCKLPVVWLKIKALLVLDRAFCAVAAASALLLEYGLYEKVKMGSICSLFIVYQREISSYRQTSTPI